ncbi:MAG: FlgD immunoglobulin-like domain containing protein [Candidatus Latescibacterota bacterium]
MDADGGFRLDLVPGWYALTAGCGTLEVAAGRTFDIAVGDDGTPVIAQADPRPHLFRLGHAYPNPSNGQTVIPFELPEPGPVSLVVYDILGQRVRELVREARPAGVHRAVWDGRDATGRTVDTGVYLCRLQAGACVQVARVLLLR